VFVKGGAGIDVCGGVVSSKSGSFWCTKGVECTTASHGTKMSLAQNHVYIRATSPGQLRRLNSNILWTLYEIGGQFG
jgi:hypothetical protein